MNDYQFTNCLWHMKYIYLGINDSKRIFRAGFRFFLCHSLFDVLNVCVFLWENWREKKKRIQPKAFYLKLANIWDFEHSKMWEKNQTKNELFCWLEIGNLNRLMPGNDHFHCIFKQIKKQIIISWLNTLFVSHNSF